MDGCCLLSIFERRLLKLRLQVADLLRARVRAHPSRNEVTQFLQLLLSWHFLLDELVRVEFVRRLLQRQVGLVDEGAKATHLVLDEPVRVCGQALERSEEEQKPLLDHVKCFQQLPGFRGQLVLHRRYFLHVLPKSRVLLLQLLRLLQRCLELRLRLSYLVHQPSVVLVYLVDVVLVMQVLRLYVLRVLHIALGSDRVRRPGFRRRHVGRELA